MPRTPRKQSATDIYHVMIRGMDRLQLFYDDADRKIFLERLAFYREECGIAIYAWCLMGNHVHLLLKADLCVLSHVMKKIQLSYSHYYNAKYDRKGYLFQDRFKSKPVENESYFLEVLRYIILNPTEAGSSYKDWTSFNETIDGAGLIDGEYVISHFGENRPRALKAFIEFISTSSQNERIGLDQCKSHIKDAEAIAVIREEVGGCNCAALCDMGISERNAVVRRLREKGLSIRQISRLTGLNRGIIQKASRRT